MFGTILEQSIFLYVIAAAGICGIAARLIVNGFLGGLIKGVGNMRSTGKKSLVEIRKRYEEFTYLDVNIRNTKSFVEKYIYKLRLGKINIAAWNSFCRNMMVFAAGTGLVGAWWQYRNDGSLFESAELIMWGIVACGVMQIVYNIFDSSRKCEVLSAELVNYLDNSLTNRLKRETEKQESARVESAAQKSGKKSGQLQTAASIMEPNVIDIDAALAQMENARADKESVKKSPGREKKTENLEKSKKAIKAEQRKSEQRKMEQRNTELRNTEQRKQEKDRSDEHEVTEEQIAACDALFDKLLKGISTT